MKSPLRAPAATSKSQKADADRFRWLIGWQAGESGASFEQTLALMGDVPAGKWREAIDGWRTGNILAYPEQPKRS